MMDALNQSYGRDAFIKLDGEIPACQGPKSYDSLLPKNYDSRKEKNDDSELDRQGLVADMKNTLPSEDNNSISFHDMVEKKPPLFDEYNDSEKYISTDLASNLLGNNNNNNHGTFRSTTFGNRTNDDDNTTTSFVSKVDASVSKDRSVITEERMVKTSSSVSTTVSPVKDSPLPIEMADEGDDDDETTEIDLLQGEVVSSQTITSRSRTVETTTYSLERDGDTETRVEQKVTIQSDGDSIDHDEALAQAIREATEMNPDMTVEKIEIHQTANASDIL